MHAGFTTANSVKNGKVCTYHDEELGVGETDILEVVRLGCVGEKGRDGGGSVGESSALKEENYVESHPVNTDSFGSSRGQSLSRWFARATTRSVGLKLYPQHLVNAARFRRPHYARSPLNGEITPHAGHAALTGRLGNLTRSA